MPVQLTYFPRKTPSGERILTGESVWLGRTEAGVRLRVAGAEDAPYPALLETLTRLLDQLPETMRAIEAHVRALPPSTRILLERRDDEAFAARICGFDGPIDCLAIAVTSPDAPTSASVELITGEPDGYVSFRIQIDDGTLGAITACLS